MVLAKDMVVTVLQYAKCIIYQCNAHLKFIYLYINYISIKNKENKNTCNKNFIRVIFTT